MTPFSAFLTTRGRAESIFEVELARILEGLALSVPAVHQDRILSRLKESIDNGERDPWAAILPALIDRGDLLLSRRWRFHEKESLPTIIDEILIREEYFLPPPLSSSPLFIDCGANIGLGTYFLKRRYPDSRIIAYEPHPEIFQILAANVRRSGYADVLVENAAIGARADQGVLTFGKDSLSSRLGASADPDATTVGVRIVALPDVLRSAGPVEFLKVDIEGAEAQAIPACGALLRQCRFVFVECHAKAGEVGGGTLRPVLDALADAGFAAHVGRTAWSERKHTHRPFRHAANGVSHCVYARRLDPPSEA